MFDRHHHHHQRRRHRHQSINPVHGRWWRKGNIIHRFFSFTHSSYIRLAFHHAEPYPLNRLLLLLLLPINCSPIFEKRHRFWKLSFFSGQAMKENKNLVDHVSRLLFRWLLACLLAGLHQEIVNSSVCKNLKSQRMNESDFSISLLFLVRSDKTRIAC